MDQEPVVREEMRVVDAEGDTDMHDTEDKIKGRGKLLMLNRKLRIRSTSLRILEALLRRQDQILLRVRCIQQHLQPADGLGGEGLPLWHAKLDGPCPLQRMRIIQEDTMRGASKTSISWLVPYRI